MVVYRCRGEDTREILHQFPGYQPPSDPTLLDSGMWKTGFRVFRHDSHRALRIDGGQARYRVRGKDVQRDELMKEIDRSMFLVLSQKTTILWSHSNWSQPRHEYMHLVRRPMGTMDFGYEMSGKIDGEGRKGKIDVSRFLEVSPPTLSIPSFHTGLMMKIRGIREVF